MGVVRWVLIGDGPSEDVSSGGVEGKKYKSPPLGPSKPSIVGEDGVRRPVAFWRASGDRVAVASRGVGAWICWWEDDGREYTKAEGKGIDDDDEVVIAVLSPREANFDIPFGG